MNKEIIIIGSGLSGLTTAYLLKKQGVSVQILEANSRIGGRIFTKVNHKTPVELGATWLWKYNTGLIKLCNELAIELFEQKMDGDALFEAMSAYPPQRFNLPPNQEISYRIANGTSALIEKLADNIGRDFILLNEKVHEIQNQQTKLFVKSETNEFMADGVISTIPPRLLVNSVKFIPELSKDLVNAANETHTWMKDSIKFAVIYSSPFWRKEGLSGVGFSNVGPFTELYDHCTIQDDQFALIGFLNGALAELNHQQREEKVVTQLQKFFGEKALGYISYEEKVWRKESLTTIADHKFIFPHQNNGHEIYQDIFMDNKLYISGTETSKVYGGYMEGAVQRAQEICNQIKKDWLS